MNQRFSRWILAFRASCVALVWLTLSSSGHAQEVGRVISSTPVVQQAGFDTRVVAYNVCTNMRVGNIAFSYPKTPDPPLP